MTADFYGMSTLLQDLENGQLGKQASDFLLKKENEAPYASLVYILQAKQTEDPEARFKAAIFSPDRGKLRSMLKEEFLPFKRATRDTFELESQTVTPTPAPEPTPETVPVVSVPQPKTEIAPTPSPSSDVEFRPVAMWKISPFSIQKSDQEATVSDSSWRFTIDIPHTAPVEATPLNDFVQEQTTNGLAVAQKVSDELAASREDDQDLVNRFLASPPARMKRKAASEAESHGSDQTESLKDDQNFATETLAQLHLRQNHPEEALKIYQQLRLRYPEKSVYFDAQIEKIKQRII